jgi:hypothetical protein
MKRVFIFVNGILSWPSDADGWTDRAVTWTNIRTESVGEKYEYVCGPLTRRLKQQRRAEGLAKMCRYYANCVGQDPHETGPEQPWEIHLVGHSNGCDIILRTLKLLPRFMRIKSVHLIAAACEADFDANGLNEKLWNGQLGRVEVYTGGEDHALKFATLTGHFLSPFGLGYGSLGLTGPKNAADDHRIVEHHEPFFGHSTWFEPVQFPTTLTHITKPFAK